VRGVPYDKRSDETLAYVGSLVCRTLEVDKSTLSKTDYVRVKIGARDVSKVHEVTEGSIGLYMISLGFPIFRKVQITIDLGGFKTHRSGFKSKEMTPATLALRIL
jgi:hypothetical protein